MTKPRSGAPAVDTGAAAHQPTVLPGSAEPAEALRFLAAIVASSDDAIIGKTLDGIITSWNAGAERIYGYTADEVVGRPIALLIPPDRRDELPKILARIREGERIEHYETERIRKDGRRISISLTVSPIHAGGGRIVGASAIARDVTERKRADAELRERNRALETLIRVNAAIAAELDLERLVQLVTDAATELTGARFGAFFHNVSDDAGESYQLYTLSGAPRAAFAGFPMPRNTAVFGPTFRGEGVVRSDDITQDPRYGRNPPHHGAPEGHLPVRSYLAAPVISRSGQTLGGLFFGHPEPGVFTELAERLVTGIAAQAAVAIDNARLYQAAQAELAERERAEAAVRESEERLRFTLEAARVGTWDWDMTTGRVRWSENLEALHGLPPGSFGGDFESVLRDVHAADRERVLATLRRAAAGEGDGEYRIEYRLLGDDGGERWVEGRGRAIRDGGRRPVRMAGICTDISERKRSERMLQLLLAELQHRVKNTLAVIQAIAGQTGARAATVDDFLAAFQGRLNALAAAHSLLTASSWRGASLLDLARETLAPHLDRGEDGGRARLEVEDVALNPAAATTFALVFHELATNADKYGALSAPGGRVLLTARVERGEGEEDGGGLLRVAWEETGGPPARRPERAGFGTVMIVQAIEYQHAGRAEMLWRDEGLLCRLSLPLDEVAAEPRRGRGVAPSGGAAPA